MLDMLIAPIVSMIPAPPQRAIRAIIPGEGGDLRAGLEQLNGLLPAAIEGAAGRAIEQSLQQATSHVEQVTAAGVELDLLDEQARQAIMETSASVAEIAQQCLTEMVQAAALHPLGAPLPATLLPIANRHYVAAEAELQALEAELDELAAEVNNVDIPEQAREPVTEEPAPAPAQEVESGGTPQAQAAVTAAKSALGTPYQWGGTTPGVGFDCSGLTQWAYAQAGLDIPRTADAQAIGPQIPRDQVQPGDLAVWDGHVAMIVDEGHFIEAGDPVQISSIRENNIGMAFKGFYRPTAA